MATIKIQRTNEIQNFFGNYQICIDGQIIGKIAHGKIKEFEVTSGRHTIIALINWCRSQELSFDCNDNDTKTFSLSGFKYKWLVSIYLGLIALVILLITTMIIQKNDLNNLIFLLIPVSILIVILSVIHVCYLTLGRKKYLQLKELNPIIDSKAN